MKLIQVAAAVLNQTPLDWAGNRSRILAAIEQARAQRASVVCLPELCITGYGCEDAFHSLNTVQRAWRTLQEIMTATQGLIVSVGLPVLHRNGLFNCACLIVDGKIAGFVAKRFLAGDGIHYEPRWFKPWPADARAELSVDGGRFPIGDLCFDCGGVRIGFEICEDAWVANRPGAALALKAADLILNPSASHFAFGKLEVRKRFVVEQASVTVLNWKDHDIPLQNIQARVRSPGIWLVANLKNALLLSTSNRSEAAVGYATMDGDTSGGLSPLAGIDKAWLRHWLRWLETTGPKGLKPIPELSVINRQAPTAELRPADQRQTDEDDLMPYDVLDAVERAAIRDRRAPVEVFEILRVQFPGHAATDLGVWVERFFTLWCRNQWKRERYAPSFHLDDENLDPKTWCRFPILSGGFAAELAELRERLRTC